MDSVINEQYLQVYTQHFCDSISDPFFSNKSSISGEEILQLTQLQQINLMVIKILMGKWMDETGKLKSPYFNYEETEVKNALNQLMNVLSRNIRIHKKDFIPLFKEAVSDTLILIFSPYEFFFRELGKPNKTHTKKTLLEEKKFIKINSGLFTAFVEKIESSDKVSLSGEEARKLFNKVCEEISFDPDDPDPYIDILSQTEPIYLQKMYKELEENSLEDTEKEADTDITVEVKKAGTVQDQFVKPASTLMDDLSKNPSNTILDYHQKQKIDSIRKNISIHQKFMFVKELFQNEENEFYQVIEFLDGCTTREEALEYLENNYFNPGLWKDDDEPVIEFMTVIDKKFI
jgi:hypothetical protein